MYVLSAVCTFTENDHHKFVFIYIYIYIYIYKIVCYYFLRIYCHVLFQDHIISGINFTPQKFAYNMLLFKL